MKTVPCPVTGDEIDGGDCLLICDVADRLIKPTILPEGINWDEEQRKKCKACKYHADLDETAEKAIKESLNNGK